MAFPSALVQSPISPTKACCFSRMSETRHRRERPLGETDRSWESFTIETLATRTLGDGKIANLGELNATVRDTAAIEVGPPLAPLKPVIPSNRRQSHKTKLSAESADRLDAPWLRWDRCEPG
jgi:hypothetical protein